MKPVEQLVLHNPVAGHRGDCIRACLASLLEIEPEAMPNFVDNHGPMGWWDEIRRWLRDDLARLGLHGPLDLGAVEHLDDVIQWGADQYAYAIATVQSPRGSFGHCVVVDRHGDIAHDPSPTGKLTGRAEPLGDYWVLTVPYDPYPTQIADIDRAESEAA